MIYSNDRIIIKRISETISIGGQTVYRIAQVFPEEHSCYKLALTILVEESEEGEYHLRMEMDMNILIFIKRPVINFTEKMLQKFT